MGYGELVMGPMDPDSSSELTRNLGVHNKAKVLLQRHARNFPKDLVKQLARPVDRDRTVVLRERLDLVEDVARDVGGRKAFLKEDSEVVDAAVRGLPHDRDRIVVVTYFSPQGRDAQAVLPYDSQFAAVEDEYARRERAKEAGQLTPGEPQTFELSGEERDDGATQAAVQAAEEARAAQRDAEARAAELAERLEAVEDPEPFEGYGELNADDLIARIKSDGYVVFGTAGLDGIEDYEARHKNRSTVLSAVEAARDDAPSPDAD